MRTLITLFLLSCSILGVFGTIEARAQEAAPASENGTTIDVSLEREMQAIAEWNPPNLAVTDRQIGFYLYIARRYFKKTPGCDVRVIVDDSMSDDILGSASPDFCTMVLNDDVYPMVRGSYMPDGLTIREQRAYSRALLCTVVVHEFGHLIGLEHSTKPGSVMAPSANPAARTGCPRVPAAVTRSQTFDVIVVVSS